MESYSIYLLKSALVLLLFLTAYQLFLKKETFFKSNRIFLLVGLAVSLTLPLITITKTVFVERPENMYPNFQVVETPAIASAPTTSFDWRLVILAIYLLGILFFGIRLLVQLFTIAKMKREGHITREDDIVYVKTEERISPFSFFKHIFFYPQRFLHRDLNLIIQHEKVHARQWHSIDILLTEIILILQWFNPVIWSYKGFLKQNLEFLADAETCANYQNKKHYQYLMLQQALNKDPIEIVNPFFNSIIKKRIVMLNQKQSKKINHFKLLLVLPFLILFLLSFNVKEEVKFSETPSPIVAEDIVPEFISPLDQNDIEKISSSFGIVEKDAPIESKFHRGIDLVARIGAEVIASAEGIVGTAAFDATNGNYVIMDHEEGYRTKYLHLKGFNVTPGMTLQAGEVLGHVGNTGKSTGPHLHFEILKSESPIDPETLIPFNSKKKVQKNHENRALQSIKNTKQVELVIDKDTSDEELEKIKGDLAKDGIDFSYTTVRNESREIIDISLQVSGEGTNGSSFKNSHNSSDEENGITPLVVFIDRENNMISIGTKGAYQSNQTKISKGSKSIWISSNDEGQKKILVKKDGANGKIYVNGEEVDEDGLHEHDINLMMNDKEKHSDSNFSFHFSSDDDDIHEKHVKIKKGKSKKDKRVFVIKDSDKDTDVEVINSDEGFFYIDTDGKDPLYVIDGREATKKEVKKLSPEKIATIDVSKGEAASKKYGEKAKNGVVEISTKKKEKE